MYANPYLDLRDRSGLWCGECSSGKVNEFETILRAGQRAFEQLIRV